MTEPPETLRNRVERVYRFQVMEDELALKLALPDAVSKVPRITPAEQLRLTTKMCVALRVALFDLAEQLDTLLDGQIKPE